MHLTDFHRFSAALLGLVILATVAVLSGMGVFVGAQGWLYDYLTQVRLSAKRPASQVLLIDVSPAPWAIEPSSWTRLISTLDTAGVAAIALVEWPQGDVLPQPPLRAKGIVASYVDVDRSAHGGTATDISGGWTHAALELPASSGGIQRTAAYDTAGMPSLARAVAEAVHGRSFPDEGDFVVNFSSGADWMPRLHLDKALGGDLIPELVRDKIVVVGMLSLPGARALMSPLSDSVALPELEYHAYAIETLLRRNAVQALPIWLSVPLMLLVTAAAVTGYQRLTVRLGLRVTLALLLVYVAVAWVFLHLLSLRIPLIELGLLQVVLFAAVMRGRQLQAEDALNKMLADTSHRLHGRLFPVGFYDTPEHWAHVITMVDQTLDMTRSMFLETVEGDHRVREVRALRCSLDDIDERRRDIQRTPYSSAIEQGGLLRLDKVYLKPLEGIEEIQYMIPLSFGGEVLGFWSYGIDVARQDDADSIEPFVRIFARHIGEMLYHRRAWHERRHREQGSVGRYLRMEGGAALHRRVHDSIALLEERMDVNDQVIRSLDTATIFFDPFGRVMQMNAAMESLGSANGLPLYELNALDLLVRISCLSAREARHVLRNAVLNKREARVAGCIGSDKGKAYRINVKPVVAGATNDRTGAMPFDVAGVAFELIDTTDAANLFRLQQSLVVHMMLRLRNDIEGVMLGTHMLENAGDNAETRMRINELVKDKINDMTLVLTQVESELKTPMQALGAGPYPCDLQERLLQIVQKKTESARAYGVEIVRELPNFSQLTYAQPDGFDELVGLVLDLLIKDAVKNGQVRIRCHQQEGCTVFEFENTGFGLPDVELQRYLTGPELPVTEEFRRLRAMTEVVKGWGGQLWAHSDMGEGFRIGIRLESAL